MFKSFVRFCKLYCRSLQEIKEIDKKKKKLKVGKKTQIEN